MNKPFGKGDQIPVPPKYENIANNSSDAELGPFFVIGASARGQMHIHEGSFRDDAYYMQSDGHWAAIALADGAGSCKLSRIGASFSVNKLCKNLLNSVIYAYRINRSPIDEKYSKFQLIDQQQISNQILSTANGIKTTNILEQIINKGFKKTHQELIRFAAKHSLSMEDLHCTLLGLVINSESKEMAFGQVGDGLILGRFLDGSAIPLVEPITPDVVDASYFFTESDWLNHFVSGNISGDQRNTINTLYLMSDGVANDCLYGPPDNILQRWANDMNREMRSKPLSNNSKRLEHYLETYRIPGSYDDRTLLVVLSDHEGVVN